MPCLETHLHFPAIFFECFYGTVRAESMSLHQLPQCLSNSREPCASPYHRIASSSSPAFATRFARREGLPFPYPLQQLGAGGLQILFCVPVAFLANQTDRRNRYFLFMDPVGLGTRRYNMHYKCHSTSTPLLGSIFRFPDIFFYYVYENDPQNDAKP